MARQIKYENEGRRLVLNGIEKLAKAVKTTLGPRGRNVMIDRDGEQPFVTKDGVTVAKNIFLEDPYENMGAQMVKEVASKTNDNAGDGTTTATVLAEAIFREGLKNVTAGANPMSLKRGIDKAVDAVVSELGDIAMPVSGREQIAQVAAISANNDSEIGEIIADAMDKVGKDGIITVEESNAMETTCEAVEGMRFDNGYLSPYFVSDMEKMTCVLDEPYILVYERKISNLQEMLPLLQLVAKEGKPLLMISENVESEALQALVVNKLRGSLNVCAVKAPGFGDMRRDMLLDIAILTGAVMISSEVGPRLENVTLDMLGQAKTVVVAKDSTTIIDGYGEPEVIKGRAEAIREQIEACDSEYDREKLQQRLARIAGGVAVIRIGATTEAEMKEKKDRVEDALNATRAAVEEGIVAGGGVALIRASDSAFAKLSLEGDEATGADIIARAVEEPLRQIAQNAGIEGSIVVMKTKELDGFNGYDAYNDRYANLLEAGVIDPKKVTRCALQNAASVAGLLLTTDCMICDIPSKDDVVGLQPDMP